MTILAAGGEHDAFSWPSTQPTSSNFSTSGSLFDSNFCSGAITLSGTTMFARSVLATAAQTDVWVHFQEYFSTTNASNNVPLATLYNASDVGVLRVYQVSSTSRKLQYWNGSAWTDIGSAYTQTSGSRVTIDIHCKINDSGGEFSLYVDTVLKATMTGDTNVFSGSEVSYVEMAPTHSANATNQGWSQFIVSTDDTRQMRLATLRPDGAGATSDWAGTYADVDDVGFYTDSDYLTSNTANQVDTLTLTNLSTLAQTLEPLAVVVTGRARRGTSGPQNVQLGLHVGSTDYFAANEPSLGSSFNNLTQRIWDQNPDTTADWTVSDIQSLQAGVKSIA